MTIIPQTLTLSPDGVFYSLQGEGITMGCAALFLRLHHCNLSCTWCDTRYTWDNALEEYHSGSAEVSVPVLAGRLKSAWDRGCINKTLSRRLVITGGEPLMQLKGLDELVDSLEGWVNEVETNGTIMPSPVLLERCQFNCSPKLSHSGVSAGKRIKASVIKAILNANSQFKFVVQGPEDIGEAERDFIKPFDIPADRVIIMAQGVTQEQICDISGKVVERVKLSGYRLLPRLQVSLWGARRRV